MIKEAKYKKGRKVYVDCDTGMGTGGPSKISEVGVRYDKMTGEKYFVYLIDKRWWNENGGCDSNPAFMYSVDYDYFERKERIEAERIPEPFEYEDNVHTFTKDGPVAIREVFDHELFMTFNNDSGAISFREWMNEMGEDMFIEYCKIKEDKVNNEL